MISLLLVTFLSIIINVKLFAVAILSVTILLILILTFFVLAFLRGAVTVTYKLILTNSDIYVISFYNMIHL